MGQGATCAACGCGSNSSAAAAALEGAAPVIPAATSRSRSRHREEPEAALTAEVEAETHAPTLPIGWRWPQWCLDVKSPSIEVYVVASEEDEGECDCGAVTAQGRWVVGEPRQRVVNKQGHDAFLEVEYEWDGEAYVQDFGPQHVRRRGTTATVQDLFRSSAGASASLGEHNEAKTPAAMWNGRV
eukprot:CAMPEP_0180617666 /NCGR_PEP_ID=MMETSP1037_2-20121125/33154_1 /TAXON_ID=632150 /ORGANISM="Azadinium spinosum, Strain 3D9" /LENGTH=184 /DNA_ID=CAMNT_0022637625 /DNA_START=42 /DNA_END=596 /DNA_ORIENTATION=+